MHRFRCAGVVLLAALIVIGAAAPAVAHETDQFTVPAGREFADLGKALTRWAYRAIETGVERTNTKIRGAVRDKRDPESLKKLQSPDEVAAAVNAAFPPALFLIEQWDVDVQSAKSKANFPGRVVGYKPFIGVRKHAEFALDPFRAWNCATIKAYGTYFGTDKIGHFSDMGKHYYRRYRQSLAEGKSEEHAMRDAINLGVDGPPFFSETGFLGERTAGAYSNADLVSNFMGMMFYRNLTDEVMLHGQKIPPMLERDGAYWKINPRVRPDSAFFSLFISDHLDEALNPSRYIERLRDKIRKGIQEHDSETIDRYVDAHGNRRPREYFQKRQEELSTYWGFDYGHKGSADKDLLTIANTCFPPVPSDMKVDAHDRVGMTPLHHAARDGDVERMRKLIARDGDVNDQVRSRETNSPEWGSTPLHYAVRDGHVEVVKLLLEKGADVNAANDRGVTPLHRAIGNAEIAKVLIDAGAKPGATDERGETPLHWAALDGAPEMMDVLFGARANVAAADHQGRTPLHVAAAAGNETSAKALVAHKVRADVADQFGITPLHLASRRGAVGVVNALLDAGAAPNAQDRFGVTPLREATRHNAPAVVSRLLDANADPMLADAYGTTPLHVAARHGREPIARLLLEAGADAQAKAGPRGTPIDEARRAKNGHVLALMREAQGAARTASSSIEPQ